MTQILVSGEPTVVREAVNGILSAATLNAGYSYSPNAITLKLVDSDQIVGGLLGSTNWGWLYIEILAVDITYQRQGLGRDLVAKAEEIARERGCFGSWVNTFTFQSPDFYTGLGYEEFGQLPHYPSDQSRIFLRKLFS